MSPFYSTVITIGSRLALAALVLVAGVTESAAHDLEHAPTVGARPRCGPVGVPRRVDESSKTAIDLHVAATAKPRDIGWVVVSCISVDVVTVGRLPPAVFTVGQSVGPLGARTLGLGSSGVAPPRGVCSTAGCSLGAQINDGRARMTVSSLVLVTRCTEPTAGPGRLEEAVKTGSHATNVTPNMPSNQRYYGGQEITRAEAEADLERWLALNPARADRRAG